MTIAQAASSVALPRIRIAAHRCFRDATEFELRPLTLLYGRNQAGKSTLLRLLPLLGDSLVSSTGPLDMTSPALRGATFKELGWLGPGFESTQRFGFDAPLQGGARSSIRVEIVDEGSGPIVNRVSAFRAETAVFDATLDARPTNGTLRARYQGLCEGRPWNDELDLARLLPRELPAPAEVILEDVRRALAPLQQLQWLHAHRFGARDPASRAVRHCSPTGADLPFLLQRFPGAVQLASEWLEEKRIVSSLRLGRDGGGAPRFEVQPQVGWEHLPLSLAGEGLRAALPILLCACWSEAYREHGPALLVVEEPEGQLHPRLQVALADRLIQSACRGLPVVVETHSVHVLRAMQLAVLKGPLQPSQVALYWVDQGEDGSSRLRAIDVQADATLEGWPPGVFEEEQELARGILTERWAREDGS